MLSAFYFGMSWEETSDSFTFDDKFQNRCPKTEKSLLSGNIDIVISDSSEKTIEKTAELVKSGGDMGIIVKFENGISDDDRKSITNSVALKVGEQIGSLSADNRLYGIKIYKE